LITPGCEIVSPVCVMYHDIIQSAKIVIRATQGQV
jgi:hypothetical protein